MKMRIARHMFGVVSCVMALLTVVAAQVVEVFEVPEGNAGFWRYDGAEPGVLRTRRLQIRLDGLRVLRAGDGLSEGRRILFLLDEEREGIVERVSSDGRGNGLLAGVLGDRDESQWRMVFGDGEVVGEASWPGSVFRWASVEGGGVLVEEMNAEYQWPAIEPDEGDSLLQQENQSGIASWPLHPVANDNNVDLLVLYTEGVRMAIGGSEARVSRELQVAVDFVDEAMQRAGSPYSIKLVGVEYLGAVDDDDLVVLESISKPGGQFVAQVNAERRRWEADLVHVYTNRTSGKAWRVGLGGPALESFHPARGFGVSGRIHVRRGFVLAHEVGHNLGLLHDRRALALDAFGSDRYLDLRDEMAHPEGLGFARWDGNDRCVASTIMTGYWLTCSQVDVGDVRDFSGGGWLGSSVDCVACPDALRPRLQVTGPANAQELLRGMWPGVVGAYSDRPAAWGSPEE